MYSVNFAPLTPITFLDRTALVFPERTAVVYGERRYTYRHLRERVHRLAAALRQAGIRKDDRVAVLCPNTPPILEAHFGVPLAGGVLVAINTRLSPGEIEYILAHSGARVLIADADLLHLVEPIRHRLPALERIVVDPLPGQPGSSGNPGDPAEPPAGPDTTYEAFLAAAPAGDVQPPDLDERDMITINYTSGTTGKPKGVVYHHRGAYLNALAEIIETGLTPGSVYLWTLPMFHCNGWCFPWAVTAIGATHVLLRKVVPADVQRLIESEGVTHFCGAPTVLTGLATHLESQGARLPHPVRIITAAAPPSPQIIRTMERLGAQITHVYGLTEVYGPFTICEWHAEWDELPLEERARLKARQGVPYIALGEHRVVDPKTGQDVPRDGQTIGEVWLRGNGVMLGYFENPDATEKAFAGGWFHTGDLAVWHPDGYIELKDRAKDIIISGGENISTQEVEKVIAEHPAVLEVAVVGIPDPKWGEVPKAFVTLRPGATATAEEIIAFCRERIAHFKCPKAVEFGELPKTSTGKIQKFVLREREWAGYEKRIN
ncbi:long-chain-fatty-acid--CoA ligase [Caldinitratiruptor microaerophilus]|uniref:Acyl-CoA synthetase n=1 Tax=Caldinitratiruptor microaerophilus TaxID=671077 RepID=A0AA35CND9_9FIRM|nr:long-chain-fatty-acid--CoA ligase [Caldinitratiruptor microaerophilus]BDG61598.1 acyl-CoA synthetase [Caldinitratiruptor microaerophilus]